MIANIENGYIKSNPMADCTAIGVITVINKLRAKNMALADVLNKSLADRDIPYTYAAIQWGAEDYL